MILIPLQKKTDQRILEIKKQTINIIEKELNRKISYSSISPSLFMYMEFRDFSILDNDTELININRIRIYYNLFEILSGDVLKSLKEIRIVKSKFNFRYDDDMELISLFAKYIKNIGTDLNIPNIKISGRNLKVKLTKGKESIQLSKFLFNIDYLDKEIYFDTKGIIKTKINWFKPLTGSSKFLVSGTISDSIDFINTRIVLKSIENNLVSINKLSLQTTYKDGLFNFIKIEDAKPLDIRVSYSTINHQLSGKFASEKFILQDYFIPKDIDSTISQWFGTSITGTAEFYYLLHTDNFSYIAEIEAITNNNSLPIQALLDISLTGNDEGIDFLKLEVVTNDGIVSFQGDLNFENFLPSGNLYLSYNLFKTEVIAKIYINRKNNEIILSGTNITINGIKIFNFNSELYFLENYTDFQISFGLNNPKEISPLNNDLIQIDGNIQHNPNPFLNLAINTVNTPIDTLIKMIPSPIESYFKGIPKLGLDLESFIITDFRQYSFSASKIEFYSMKGDKLKFSAFGNNEHFEINNISGNWNDRYLDGLVKAKITDRAIFIDLDIIYEELPYTLALSYYKDKTVFFEGNYGLSGSLFRLGNTLEFRLSTLDFPIPISETITKLTLDTAGFFYNANNWKASVNNFTISNISGLAKENTLNLKGYISENEVSFTTIRYIDILSSLTGTGYFIYDNSKTLELNGDFSLFSLDKEHYEAKIDIKNNDINLIAEFNDAPVSRFNNIPVSGNLNGKLEFTSLLSEPDIRIIFQLENGEFNSHPLEIDTSIGFYQNKLQLDYFRIDYMDQILQKGMGEYNINTGEFFITLKYLGLFDNKHLATDVELKGNTISFKSRAKLSEIMNNDYFLLSTFDNIFIDNTPSESWKFKVERNKKIINYYGGPQNSIKGYMNDNGDLSIILNKQLPLSFEGEGRIKEGLIDFKIDNIEIDISLINLFTVVGKFIEFTDGTAFGHLDISGAVTNPDYNGTLHVKEASANVLMVPERIKPFDVDIMFKDKTMAIAPKNIQISDNIVIIDFNTTFSKWLPGSWSLNIDTDEEQLHIIYGASKIGLSLDGFVIGKLSISSNEYGIRINSDLNVNDCIITLDSIKPDSSRNSSALFADMKFTLGRKVQFLWPSNTLPILRATANTGQVLNFTMDNLSKTYSLNGEIEIKYGSIYYFQKSFFLSEGSLTFNENETKFDPLLAFRAHIREVDDKGELVNISLILDKMPVSKFTPHFESDPPLSDIEIFSILGTGLFAEIGNEEIDLTSVLLLTGDLVAQFGIIKNFEKRVKDTLNLDLFSIRTQMIQNILINRFVDTNDVNDKVYQNNLGSYLDNTSLYLGKYFGDDIFMQAVMQISTQGIPEDGQLDATNELFIDSSVSFEWQTPLFLLGITIKPDFNDPIESVQNTNLNLSWSHSY